MSKYKVGDRVEYRFNGKLDDVGTIMYPHDSKPYTWWVRWDSDGDIQSFSEDDYKFSLAHDSVNTEIENIKSSIAELQAKMDRLIEIMESRV